MNVQDPYKDIEFEVKQVKILDKDGKTIFEDQIEFPKDFENNAAAIVASRYLCNDSKHKETSLKQMFDRVSDTIADWGEEQGYFGDSVNIKSNEEIKEFRNKLKYYQINKYFAFNSPVN